MWQLILVVLSVFLTTTQADIQNFYGNWTAVMQFPDNLTIPTCLKYTLSKENDLQCQCVDGKTTTLLDFNYVEYSTGQNPQHFPIFKKSFPVLEAKTAEEVVSSLGVSCTCGGKFHPIRLAVRRINEDYFILYQAHTVDKDFYSSAEPNEAIVQGRTVQTASEIQKIVNQVQDLTGRRGKLICSLA